MLIRIGYEMAFDVPRPAPMVLVLDTHPDWDSRLKRPARLRVEPSAPIEDYVDGFGNRCSRIVAPPGRVTLWADGIMEDEGRPEPTPFGAAQHRVEDLPPEALVYLLASRYCEVDKLSDIAWNLFGNTLEGWPRVAAISTWVHQNVTFGYQFARPTKSAFDVYEERRGVCRDFNHLALTFCRCMNIPARYATGYLGDIGVPLSDSPMDFSGWFEVFLGGRWQTCDARHNVPRIGKIVMARGRDATDVALTTSFGTATLNKFVVWTDEVGPEALDQPPRIKQG